MARPHELKAIGYWQGDEEPGLPHPEHLVRDGWLPDERAKIIAYLDAGREYMAFMGYSFCRFKCGIDEAELGCRDLTDGEWVWPEGLAHYLENHDVILPAEFVDSMRARNWTVPANPVIPDIETGQEFMDMSFWLEWSSRKVGAKK